MLRYIFISTLLITLLSSSLAQEKKEKTKIRYPKTEGIAIGVDFAPLILQWIDPARTGLNFLVRGNINQKWFGVGEFGYENFNQDNTRYHYQSKGMGLKMGVDYDIFNPSEEGNNDNIFFGARYSFSWQNHGSDYYLIENGYWDDYTGSYENYSFNTHFGELLFGLRTEVFKNLFICVTMRGKALIYNSNPEKLEPSSIPGYGQPTHFNFGFSYSLEYQIPYPKSKRDKPKTNEKLL